MAQQTRSEKLLAHVGEPFPCDICHKKVVANDRWVITKDRRLVCPNCRSTIQGQGILVVGV